MSASIDYGTREHWERVAGTRSTASTDVSSALVASMAEGRALEGRRVLDVGTGNGALPIAFARAGADVVGVDVTEIGVRLAEANADAHVTDPEIRKRLAFRVMGAEELDFADGAFDVITLLKTIWCLPDIAAAAREMARVLAPGGELAIQVWSTADRCDLLSVGVELLAEHVAGMHLPEGYKGPFEVTPRYVRSVLGRAGFARFSWEKRSFPVEVASPEEYWTVVRSLAGTAYYAFTLLTPEQRARVDERLWEATAKLRVGDRARFVLEWVVLTAARKR